MPNLVTLSEAKLFCRIDSDDEDATLEVLIAAATDAVRDIASDWDGAGDTPARIKLAVLSRVAIMFDNRDNLEGGKGELPMLTPLRKLEI